MAELMFELIRRYQLHESTIVLLQPTSPLRRDEDISKCIKTFKNNTFDLVFTVSSQDRAVLKSGFVRGNKFIPIAEPDFTFMNRQDLPKLFRPNGAVYVFNGGWFEKNNGFTSSNVGVVEMPKENSLDIDNQEDFDRVAQIYKKHSKK
jgi:N-acylneuraminate cytidylyltransferase